MNENEPTLSLERMRDLVRWLSQMTREIEEVREYVHTSPKMADFFLGETTRRIQAVQVALITVSGDAPSFEEITRGCAQSNAGH
jgi:hypothetical protein